MVVGQMKTVLRFEFRREPPDHVVIEDQNLAASVATQMTVTMLRVAIRVVHLIESGRESVDESGFVKTLQSTIYGGQIETRQRLAGFFVNLGRGHVSMPLNLGDQLQ